jgi:hypothetical protein
LPTAVNMAPTIHIQNGTAAITSKTLDYVFFALER